MKLMGQLWLFLCFLDVIIGARNLKYYSTHIVKKNVWGKEEVVTDYVSLAEDPKSNLPKDFTICSSVFVHVVTLTDIIVFELLKEDGSPWFLLSLDVLSRDYENLSETMKMYFENPETSNVENKRYTGTIIPIVPNSWYHICMGLDTVSGLLRIVVNGKEVVNKEKEYFKNTQSWKPKSVAGKIIQFKGYWGGMWFQYRNTFSNMNIFNSMMSVEDMVSRTSGGEDCDSPGDYFR